MDQREMVGIRTRVRLSDGGYFIYTVRFLQHGSSLLGDVQWNRRPSTSPTTARHTRGDNGGREWEQGISGLDLASEQGANVRNWWRKKHDWATLAALGDGLATGETEICTKTTQLGVYTGRGCDWRGLAGAWTTSYREPRWAHVRAAEASSLHEVSIPVHSRVNRTSHARFYTSYGADESMFHLCLLCQ